MKYLLCSILFLLIPLLSSIKQGTDPWRIHFPCSILTGLLTGLSQQKTENLHYFTGITNRSFLLLFLCPLPFCKSLSDLLQRATARKEMGRESGGRRVWFCPQKPPFLRWKIRLSCHNDILPCVTMINSPNFFQLGK